MRSTKIRVFLFLALLPAVNLSAQYRTLLNKANKEYEIHAYNQAIETYKQALERRSDDPEALGNLADSYRYLNEMLEAAKYYQRAMALRGVEARHVLNFGHVLKSLGRYEDAKRAYLEYAKDDPVVGNHYAQTCDFALAQIQANSGLAVRNETRINSPAADFGPAFSRGQVVFSSARIDIQRTNQNFTGQQPNQLYIGKTGPDGLLESPYFLQGGAQQEFNKGPAAFSPDGRFAAYSKNNFVNGTRQIPGSGVELNLFIAEVSANGNFVNEQPFPYNGNGFSTGFPAFSPDGNALYFASTRPEGFGGYDIYVSYRAGNSWNRPENLGPVVNSPGNEMTPYYDGESLFFSSDWHPGFGGFDLFRAEQLNNRWTQIFHLGNPVSSPRDDYGMIYDRLRNIGYFISNRENGRGLEDIYSVSRPAESLILTVRSASDGSPVPNAMLDLSGCGLGMQQTDDRGVFRLQATGGLNCNIVVRANGYSDQSVPISAGAQQGTRNLDIQLVRSGEQYYGKILNYTTGLPVEGVTVIATNQLTGSGIQVLTDARGDYSLALGSNSTYSIRYSRPGFRDINRTVRTIPGSDPYMLGTISILPVDSPLPLGNEINTGGGNQPAGNQGQTTGTARGYAVQVAALGKPAAPAQFSKLESVGKVYTKTEAGKYKVRVGVFQTQTQAQQALATVKRAGYPQAFIVEEPGVELALKGDAQQPPATGGQGNPPALTGGAYKVQLGAYGDVRNFNEAKARGVGTVEERRKGNLTVKYLGGYGTLDEARRARQAAVAAGFTGAFVVQEVGGELKKVQ